MPPEPTQYRCENIADNGTRRSATLREAEAEPKQAESINISVASGESSLIDSLTPGKIYGINLKEITE